jgi:ligand-binding sensor domain-containing protein
LLGTASLVRPKTFRGSTRSANHLKKKMSIIDNLFLLPFSEDIPLLNRYAYHIFCLTNTFKVQRYTNSGYGLETGSP